jgi:hypothetical protein
VTDTTTENQTVITSQITDYAIMGSSNGSTTDSSSSSSSNSSGNINNNIIPCCRQSFGYFVLASFKQADTTLI